MRAGSRTRGSKRPKNARHIEYKSAADDSRPRWNFAPRQRARTRSVKRNNAEGDTSNTGRRKTARGQTEAARSGNHAARPRRRVGTSGTTGGAGWQTFRNPPTVEDPLAHPAAQSRDPAVEALGSPAAGPLMCGPGNVRTSPDEGAGGLLGTPPAGARRGHLVITTPTPCAQGPTCG